MKRYHILSLFAMTFLVLFSSCKHTPIDPWEPDDKDPKVTQLEKYYGVEWRLHSIVHYPKDNIQPADPVMDLIPADQQITISFDKGSARGTAVCNDYSAKVFLSEYSMKVSDIISTKVACPEGSYDQTYLNALADASSYSVTDDVLEIYFQHPITMLPNVTSTLRFERVKPIIDPRGDEFTHIIFSGTGLDLPESTREVQVTGIKLSGELTVSYSYSGGCSPVNFMFFADPRDFHTPEDGITITMVTMGEPDYCKAIVEGNKVVDMSIPRASLGDETKPHLIKIRLMYNGKEYNTEGYL